MRAANRKHALEALRRRIAEGERFASHSRPAAVLSEAAAGGALPALKTGALHEFLPAAPGDFPSALGFALGAAAHIVRMRPGFLIWACPAHQPFRDGRIYPAGLATLGVAPERLVMVRAPKLKTVLWALEESLAHPGLAAVIGMLPENDRAYDFTASRRLALRAERSGVTAFLLLSRTAPDAATAAATRWRIGAEPSAPQQYVGQARPGLGTPRWRLRQTKNRKGTSGEWRVEWDYETHTFRLSSALGDRAPPDQAQTRELPFNARGGGEDWAAAS